MKKLKEISFILHQITHSQNYEASLAAVMFALNSINKAQELELVKSALLPISVELKPLNDLVHYGFFLNSFSPDQSISFISFAFFVQFFMLLSLLIQIRWPKNQVFIFRLLNHLLLYYSLIIFIPVAYSSLAFLIREESCDAASYCDSDNKVMIVIFALLNLLFATLFLMILIYYARCESLKYDNLILSLDYRLPIQAMKSLLVYLTIILAALDILQELRLTLLLIKWLASIGENLRKLNKSQYSYQDLFALSFAVVISFRLKLFDLAVVFSFALLLENQARNRVFNAYVCTQEQNNLLTILIMEDTGKLDATVQQKIYSLIIQKNHKCSKCRKVTHIPECLLKRLATEQKSQQQYILLYCDYISNYAPLKGLLRLLLQDSNDLYYRAASYNLLQQLYSRSQQIQKEMKFKNSVKNSSEHSSSLDIQSAYQTFHSSQLIFPKFIESINQKITFWIKLINGYNDISFLIQNTLETTKLILQCKQLVEERFDLASNKLKISTNPDLITMRILQVYYTGIYQNSYQAFTLERNIDELLKSERFKQDESLDNIQLVQNRMFILKTSLVRNRGDLLELSSQQLSKFLEITEESAKGIKHISQLMPQFLCQIHDNLMNNYIQNGYSKLMIHGEQSFFQNQKGFLEPCVINLFNFYDNKSDFILNMILTKEATNRDTILFGVDGKILGVTESIHNQLYAQLCQDQSQMSLLNPFKGGILLQFFLPQITSQVEELRMQISQSSNYLLNNLKGIWSLPSNYKDCLQTGQAISSKFCKKSKANLSLQRSYKSQTYSKYTISSLQSEIVQIDESNISNTIKEQIVCVFTLTQLIDNVPIVMLHPSYYESLSTNIDEKSRSQGQLSLLYSLQYKQLKYKGGQFSYFILNLRDSTKVNENCKSGQSLNAESRQPQNLSFEVLSENLLNDQPIIRYIPEVVQVIGNNHFEEIELPNQNSEIRFNDVSKLQSERSNIFQTQRLAQDPNLLNFSKSIEFNQIREEVNLIELDMDKIRKRGADQEFQYEQEDEKGENDLGNLQSNSQSNKGKGNVLENFVKQKQLKLDQGDFASNPSRTSTNSTSKDALLIVQQLYHNTRMITPLKIISLLLFLATTGIIVMNFLNVNLISNNLIIQTNEVQNLRQPQNINYFFSSVYEQFITFDLYNNGLLTASPYLLERNALELSEMFEYGRENIQNLAILVTRQGEQLGYKKFIEKVIEEETIIKQEIDIQEFYTRFYEKFESIYRYNLEQDFTDFSQLSTQGYIRLNVVEMINFHFNLILSVMNDTINRQLEVKDYFLSVMFVEMFTVVFIIGLQLKVWLFIDDIMKSIVLLVARLTEEQALDQIQRLQLIKEQLQDESSGVWKLYNFHALLFEAHDQKVKAQSQNQTQVSLQINKSNYKQNTSLFYRIVGTKFLKKRNVAITFLMAIFWSIYLMSGYLIHMQNNDDFQPSLIVTLKFVQFRHNFDSCALLATILKSEQLIKSNDLKFIDQELIIESFLKYREFLQPILNECTDQIIRRAQRTDGRSRFYGILSSNICLMKEVSIAMCNPENISNQFNEKDVFTNSIKSGVLGYAAGFEKFLSQDYSFETLNKRYEKDRSQARQVIDSQPFQNYLIQYFYDIQDTMRLFLILFQQENQEIANSIISIVSIYYLGFGMILYFGYCIVSVLWIYKSQKMANSIQQILVMIPIDLILNPNIRSQAKEIHSWLY